LNALNTAAAIYSPPMRCAVMSQVGTGRTSVVTGIRIDNRLDSIERREDRIASTYTATTIP